MDFSEALTYIKRGYRLQRTGWNDREMYVSYQEAAYDVRAYLVLNTSDKLCVPWVPSQTDILANDWEIQK